MLLPQVSLHGLSALAFGYASEYVVDFKTLFTE